MAFSQATMIARIRSVLNDNPFLDTAAEAMDTTETGLDVTSGTNYSAGQVVEFQDDGELCYITSVSTNTLNVIRNYKFSVTATAGTGTSHSNGVAIARGPLFEYAEVTDAVRASINGLYPFAYKLKTDSLTPNTDGNKWYDLDDSEILEISSAVQIVGTAPTSTIWLYGASRGAYPIDIVEGIPTAKLASGRGYYIPFLKDTSNTILVNGIAKLVSNPSGGSYADLTEGVQTDCVAYYAVARLIASTDISRMTQEDIAQGDTTIRPLARTQLSQVWEKRAYDERFKWEQELKLKVPRRQVWGHR